MDKNKPKDFTLNGFYTACIVEGIVFFILDEKLGYKAGFFYYFSGLAAYFLFLAYKKDQTHENWDSMEIFAGFLGSLIAIISPLALVFISNLLVG